MLERLVLYIYIYIYMERERERERERVVNKKGFRIKIHNAIIAE